MMGLPALRLVPVVAIGLVLLVAACTPAMPPTPTATPTPTRQATPTAGATPTATPTATLIPTPTPSTKAAKRGGIAVFPNRGDPLPWDPMFSTSITMRGVGATVYGDGGILKPCLDNIFEICPGLAKSWEPSPDFTQWTFTIRDDVKWHDGQPLTADDLKWFFELGITPPSGRVKATWARSLGDLKGLEVLPGNKLRVNLNRPTPTLLNSIAFDVNMHVAHPRHLMQPEIDKGNAKVSPDQVKWVALGPFKVTEYTKGSVVRVRRFDGYFGKGKDGQSLPYLDGIDFPIMPDHSAVLAAFRAGRLDSTAEGSGFFILPEERERVRQELGDKVWFAQIPAYPKYLSINSTRPGPWADIRVRRAASLWIDKQAGIQAIHSGDAVLVGVFSLDSQFANPDVAQWPGFNAKTKEQDRAEAKRLLAEAAFPNGFQTAILCRDLWLNYCEFLEGQLSSLLGMGNVKLDVADTPTWTDRTRSGSYDLLAGSYVIGMTPEATSDLWVTTNTTKSGAALHSDTKVDDYFQQIASLTPGNPERVRLAREVERYVIIDKAYGVAMWMEVGVQAFRDYVKGVPVPAVCNHCDIDRATVWLDK